MTGKRTRPPESVRGVMKQRAEALHTQLVSEGWELLNFASLARVMFVFGQTPNAHPTGSMKQYRPTGTNHGHTEAPQTRLYAPAWMCSVAQAVQWSREGGTISIPTEPTVRERMLALAAEGWDGLDVVYPEAGAAFLSATGHRVPTGVGAHDQDMQLAVCDGVLEFLKRWGVDPLPEVCVIPVNAHDLFIAVRAHPRSALPASTEAPDDVPRCDGLRGFSRCAYAKGHPGPCSFQHMDYFGGYDP